MDGISGASVEHARQRPANAFRTADDLLAFLNRPQSWGGTNQPYWHQGVNPTVDIIVTRRAPSRETLQVLLIQRDADAPTEGGKWALPGGFQHTTAPRGSAWRGDVESAEQACLRELREETGLDLCQMIESLIFVGSYEGNGRDPRDTPQAWSRAEVFAIALDDPHAQAALCGADDACDARWFDLDKLPDLAFDHARILRDGIEKLEENLKSSISNCSVETLAKPSS
jgi:8-oxo-dGTP diphosphatase